MSKLRDPRETRDIGIKRMIDSYRKVNGTDPSRKQKEAFEKKVIEAVKHAYKGK